MIWRRTWPLALLLGLLALFTVALRHNPREIPSPLVGKTAPGFVAPVLDRSAPLASRSLQGQVWLLNVWASWCETCRGEHALLVDLARRDVPVYGLNYKDTPEAARAWLSASGNPYRANVLDSEGRIGMDWGVYGVPETFVIDRAGKVRFRHAGPLTPELVEHRLLPLLAELRS